MKKALFVFAMVAMFVVLANGTASADLVTNGGFETGDLTGWAGSNFVTGSIDGSPHSGSYALWGGCVGGECHTYQTLATVATATYDFSFWYLTLPGPPNSLTVSWDGSPVLSLINVTQGWTYYEFSVVASTGSTVIDFGIRQDPGYAAIDDVSVNPTSSVPEPGGVALLGTGLVGLAGTIRRKLKR